MRRKLLSAVLVTTLLSLSLVHPPSLQAASVLINFDGVVTKNGLPDAGEPVVLRCKQPGMAETFIDVTFADNNGRYHITTNSLECPLGSFAHLLHPIDLHEHYDTSVSAIVRRNTIANLEIGTMTYPVPELSWAGGVIASFAGIGAIALVRRPKTPSTKNDGMTFED